MRAASEPAAPLRATRPLLLGPSRSRGGRAGGAAAPVRVVLGARVPVECGPLREVHLLLGFVSPASAAPALALALPCATKALEAALLGHAAQPGSSGSRRSSGVS